MKKLVILLISVIALFAVNSFAADKVITLDDNQGYVYFEGRAIDTCGTGDTSVAVTVYPNKLDRLFYDSNVKVSDVSGTGKGRFVLKARNLPTDSYTILQTSFYWGTGDDTTFNVTQVSTAQFYREYVYQLSKTTGTKKLKIEDIDLMYKK